MGAVLGPLVALGFLAVFPGEYRWLFLFALLPGVAAIFLTKILREKPAPVVKRDRIHFFHGFRYWNVAPGLYKRLVAGLLLFALVNSSDLLLLLRVKEAGYSDTEVIVMYIFYNLAYALMAWPLGQWADRIGLSRVFAMGIACFAVTYACFAFVQERFMYFTCFLLYAFFASCTEGVAKAWIGSIVPKEETASAIGSYAGFQSIAALLASSIAGLIWYHAGPGWAFGIPAFTAFLLSIYFLRMPGTFQKSP
jgi:MFS family permease